MSPKAERVASPNPSISSDTSRLLATYTKFLAQTAQSYASGPVEKTAVRPAVMSNCVVGDAKSPASPLAYDESKTALLLLDFHGMLVQRCGNKGQEALAKAATMRDWALEHRIMVLHSVIDVKGRPAPTCKNAGLLTKMLASIENNRSAAEEPSDVAFAQADHEYIVLRDPGLASGLKARGAFDLLSEHRIKSLILCGISTSGAILRTAMHATDEGFVVTVIDDACADPDEELHDTLLSDVLPSRAHVVDAEAFIDVWSKSAD